LKIQVKSPGRVNLIGEHTDYNGGYVLPCALNLSITLLFEKKTNDSHVHTDLGSSMSFDIKKKIKKSHNHWENYILGVVSELKKIKNDLLNFSCHIESTLPSGAGISSSSALVCGLIKGLSILNEIKLTNSQIIDLSRTIEHKYIGVKGGIMDQFTILNAKKNMAILLNCSNLNAKYINLKLEDYKILLLNTNVKHNLANSEYNQRVEECKSALKIIEKKCNHKFSNLSDVKFEDLEISKSHLSNKQYRRVSYVLKENQRTIESAKLIKINKLQELGRLMYKSHDGLKNDYEVSCAELDYLVDYSMNYEEILGSRMMGGGFGGCTINIIKENFITDYINIIKDEYFSKFATELDHIIAYPDSGIEVKII